jgi:hypothetical protein
MSEQPQFRDTFQATWLDLLGEPFDDAQREALWADVVVRRSQTKPRISVLWDDQTGEHDVPQKVFAEALQRHAEATAGLQPVIAEAGKVVVDVSTHPSMIDPLRDTLRELGAVAKFKFLSEEIGI